MPSYSGGSSGIQRRPASGRLMLAGGSMSGNAPLAEHQVASDKPHHVVSADRLSGSPPSSRPCAVSRPCSDDRSTICEMSSLMIFCRSGNCMSAMARTAPLDLAGGGEAVPERLRQAVAKQQPLLLDVRHARAGQQRSIGAEQIAASLAQCSGPRIERFVAPLRARRNVRAVRVEAAVHAASVDHVRLRVVVDCSSVRLRYRRVSWTHLDFNFGGFLERRLGSESNAGSNQSRASQSTPVRPSRLCALVLR